MAKTFVNEGLLHAVKCEWCGLKMSCNCWAGNDRNREGHILVLCPRCQVTNFLNLLFGSEDLRSVLISKIQEAKAPTIRRDERARPQLQVFGGNGQASGTGNTQTKS